jgi:hypothetical protein
VCAPAPVACRVGVGGDGGDGLWRVLVLGVAVVGWGVD